MIIHKGEVTIEVIEDLVPECTHEWMLVIMHDPTVTFVHDDFPFPITPVAAACIKCRQATPLVKIT